MTNNPLIQKYNELYNPKPPEPTKPPEPPKPVEKPKPRKIAKSYDVDSARDSFLQIAEKIKNKNAKVTSVSINADIAGGSYTGLKTYTFEVMEWDTP
jgi:hypothetical protein